jgi:transaldolase/glucose-6-phosphate isomerase
VPLADEPTLPADRYGADRVFVAIGVADEGRRQAGGGSREGDAEALLARLAAAGQPVIRITLASPLDLGAEFFRWEFAVAASGAVLGIQPFDQPDVQLAKELARRAMSAGSGSAAAAGVPPVVADRTRWRALVEESLGSAKAGDYVGLHAYLEASPVTTAALQRLRESIAHRTGLATTLGFGPRFLHSTGQLHKGGPNSGIFLQFTDDATPDLPVPEATYTFAQLIHAQAAGDAMALAQRGRRVVRFGLGADAAGGLEALRGMTG